MKLFFLWIFLGSTLVSYGQIVDSLAWTPPHEIKPEQTPADAEQKWRGLREQILTDWADTRLKPYIVLQKYTYATEESYGYINFGNGKGQYELTEVEYRVLRRHFPD